MRYLKRSGAALPAWLETPTVPPCPWKTKQEFLRDGESQKIKDLRHMLEKTKALQLQFMVDRLNAALPAILEAVPAEARPAVERRFYAVASTPEGIYALIDYVNFCGEGTHATERYQGRGWGLLQALQGMEDTEDGATAVRKFAQSAENVLEERVRNSPSERNEQRWLPGWRNRLKTYNSAR